MLKISTFTNVSMSIAAVFTVYVGVAVLHEINNCPVMTAPDSELYNVLDGAFYPVVASHNNVAYVSNNGKSATLSFGRINRYGVLVDIQSCEPGSAKYTEFMQVFAQKEAIEIAESMQARMELNSKLDSMLKSLRVLSASQELEKEPYDESHDN